MNYKITCHLMPWELDYALLSFIQLKKSKYYLDNNDKIYIDITLNLSSHIINWEESKISKYFFIDRFNTLQSLLKDYICTFKIYEGNKLYGGLDTQRESTEDHIDYYMVLNPDMYFSEIYLPHLINSSKCIQNKYFIVSSQVPKLWDSSWDVISHPYFDDIPYEKWNEIDTFDIRHYIKNSSNEINLIPVNGCKWAGWMDLYSKEIWENFWGHFDDWNGYGPCDWYSILLIQYAKTQGLDFQQYILENQITHPYHSGPLKDLVQSYKNLLVLNNIPNQKEQFVSKMQEYLNRGVQHLKEKNII